jgi:hypothetical protein
MMSLNVFPFSTNLSFRNKKMTYWARSGWFGGWGTRVIQFMTRNSSTDKGQECCYGGETDVCCAISMYVFMNVFLHML